MNGLLLIKGIKSIDRLNSFWFSSLECADQLAVDQ